MRSGRTSEMSKMNLLVEKGQKSHSVMSMDSTKKMVSTACKNDMRQKSNITIMLKKKSLKKIFSE